MFIYVYVRRHGDDGRPRPPLPPPRGHVNMHADLFKIAARNVKML